MGFLYSSLLPAKSYISHDAFCIVDDRSCVSLADACRSSFCSRMVNSTCHSFLPLICHVGHFLAANHQRSWPETENQVTIARRWKAKDKERNRFLVLSAPILVSERLAGCDAAIQKPIGVDTEPIHQSRSGPRRQPLASPVPESAAGIDHKPRLKPANVRGSESTPQEGPHEEPARNRHISASYQEEQKPSLCLLEDNDDAANVPLPPSPSPILLVDRSKGQENGPASIAASFKKRQPEADDDEDTKISVCLKKLRNHKQLVTICVKRYDGNVAFPAVLAKTSDQPSKFDASRELYLWNMYERG